MKKFICFLVMICIVVMFGHQIVEASERFETYGGAHYNTFEPETPVYYSFTLGAFGGIRIWFFDRLALGVEGEYLQVKADVIGTLMKDSTICLYGTATLKVFKELRLYGGLGYSFSKKEVDYETEFISDSEQRYGYKFGLELPLFTINDVTCVSRVGYRESRVYFAEDFEYDRNVVFSGGEFGTYISISF